MEFHILGPLRVQNVPRDGIRSVKRRALLGALLLHANKHVHRRKLIDWLWPENAALKNEAGELAKIVSAVRRVLERTESDPPINLENDQYVLTVDESLVDYHCFTRLAEQGRLAQQNGDLRGAPELLGKALALWPDQPVLAGVDLPWAQRLDETLVRESLVPAYRAYFEARLAQDQHGPVLRELNKVTQRLDTDETLAELKIRALMAVEGAGSVAAYYREFTQRLRETYDAEPGPDLAAAYDRVLDRQKLSTAYRPLERPCMLPREATDFVGRADLLRTLDDYLLAPGSSAVVALHGGAGMGKTAIIRHWANTRATHFPDGQLYFDLDGYGRGDGAGIESVLARFLTACGVGDLPPDQPTLVALLRHRLNGRRAVVVLDNVPDIDGIRALLDATRSCPVLITSRHQPRFTDCRSLAVPPLTPEESAELLRRPIDERRTREEPDAVAALVAFCAGHPFALWIAAGYVVNRAELTIRQAGDQLSADYGRRLFDAGGDDTLRGLFASSWSALRPEANRLLILLGLHPTATVTVAAAAALGGLDRAATESIFELLVTANLLEQKSATTYRLHDLLHVYLAGEAQRLGGDDRSAAVRRMADFYLATVQNAIRLIAPRQTEVPPMDGPSTATPLSFSGHDDAMDWCVEARSAVLEVSKVAAEHGLHAHVWRIIGPFGEFLRRSGDQAGVIGVHKLAVRSAMVNGDRVGEAMLLNNRAMIHLYLREYREAEQCYNRALEICCEQDDILGEATCLHNVGGTWLLRDRPEHAVGLIEEGLQLFVRAGYEEGQGRAHLRLGDAHQALGRLEIAREHFEAALEIRLHAGDQDGCAEVLVKLAAMFLDRGQDAAEAVTRCDEALAIHRRSRDERKALEALAVLARAKIKLGEYEDGCVAAREAAEIAGRRGDLRGRALALDLVARCESALGDPASAQESWTLSLALLEELRDPRAGEIEVRLAGLGAARTMPGQRAGRSVDAPARGVEQGEAGYEGAGYREESRRGVDHGAGQYPGRSGMRRDGE